MQPTGQREERAATDGLVARAASGDVDALDQLYRRYVQYTYRTCLLMLRGDHAAAEDATQDTWINVVRGVGNYRGDGAFEAWLGTVARRAAVSRRRSLAFRYEVPTPEMLTLHEAAVDADEPADRAIRRVLAGQLVQAVRNLPHRTWRDAVVLRYWHSLSIEQVASAMGKSEGAVKQYLRRAQEHLAKEALPASPAADRAARAAV
jgi:RNA polymerase sigma-70 factor, ECF subfamily